MLVDSSGVVKLADFGMAKHVSSGSSFSNSPIPPFGVSMLDPHYCNPLYPGILWRGIHLPIYSFLLAAGKKLEMKMKMFCGF